MNNAKARVFSANTLSKDVKEAYEVTKVIVRKKLKDDVPGRLHMVFDGWASGGKRSSQGIALVFFSREKCAIDLMHLDMHQ
ncbi:hypothetical protein BDZ89DRAFT_1148371 [Hymenopellis radicata]|nr:hypothetical protein BDZ89DRAFT_1148371 [Hymenopellis radicata]